MEDNGGKRKWIRASCFGTGPVRVLRRLRAVPKAGCVEDSGAEGWPREARPYALLARVKEVIAAEILEETLFEIRCGILRRPGAEALFLFAFIPRPEGRGFLRCLAARGLMCLICEARRLH
jgi:hypothetical protein